MQFYKAILALLTGIALAAGPQDAKIEPKEIHDPLIEIITELSRCESGHNPNARNPHDPETPSYGRFQYKWETWNEAIDKYGIFPAATEEADRWNLIWDGSAQETVTRKILENEPNGWRKWTNCLHKFYEKK